MVQAGVPTVPSSLAKERATNPFLRVQELRVSSKQATGRQAGGRPASKRKEGREGEEVDRSLHD